MKSHVLDVVGQVLSRLSEVARMAVPSVGKVSFTWSRRLAGVLDELELETRMSSLDLHQVGEPLIRAWGQHDRKGYIRFEAEERQGRWVGFLTSTRAGFEAELAFRSLSVDSRVSRLRITAPKQLERLRLRADTSSVGLNAAVPERVDISLEISSLSACFVPAGGSKALLISLVSNASNVVINVDWPGPIEVVDELVKESSVLTLNVGGRASGEKPLKLVVEGRAKASRVTVRRDGCHQRGGGV